MAEELKQKGKQLPAFFQNVPSDAIIRSTVEYSTPKKRRVDVLVRILDSTHRLIGVVGIENKLDSPEQQAQIADYQSALTEVFPKVHQLIIYLTPDGRAARTADTAAKCPYLPASYRTMVRLCQALRNDAVPKVQLLLDSLCSEIENAVLGDSKMEREAKELIRKLWSNPDHRKAMQLISENIPTPRKLWEGAFYERIKHDLKAIGIDIGDERPVFFDSGSENPREIKVECRGPFLEQTWDVGNFSLIYILRSEDKPPEIGSEFRLHLMAYCEKDRVRQCVKKLCLERGLPASGPLHSWWRWENIWTGGSYVLQDFGKKDTEGLAKLLLDGARSTFPTIAKRIAKLAK